MQKTPSIEESHAELRGHASRVLLKANMERTFLLQQRLPSLAKPAAIIAAMMLLINRMLRLIAFFVEENQKLRLESMELKQVNRATATMNFERVSKAHLN